MRTGKQNRVHSNPHGNSASLTFRMDSFVLAETFKYLYLLFAERDDLIFDPDDYIFTTEAHFLPLSISSYSNYYGDKPVSNLQSLISRWFLIAVFIVGFSKCSILRRQRRCRQNAREVVSKCQTGFRWRIVVLCEFDQESAQGFCCAAESRDLVSATLASHSELKDLTMMSLFSGKKGVKASEFDPSNPEHIYYLKKMGITLVTQADGKMQLVHSSNAVSLLHGSDF